MNNLENVIKNVLSDFWDERAIPSDSSSASSIDDFVDSLESITAVGVLVTLDQILETKVPLCVIKPGGYKNKEEFVNHLSNSVLIWNAKS